MKKENKIYTTAPELAQTLDISVGHAYKLIRQMNKELQQEGNYIILAGKIPTRYLEKRVMGYGA